MTQPSVVVVVVAYGHAAQLPLTLGSIASQHYPADHVQVVVVDNGDGTSAEVARNALPGVHVLDPPTNLGFAGGCNLAVAGSSADVVVLVNPDVELRPDFLAALVAALDEPGVGVTGAKLLFPDSDRIQHAGGELKLPLALTTHRGHGQPESPEYDRPIDVPYVTGAALATRHTTWERLDGLDEAFAPAYFEEVDYCLRVRKAGLRVRYVPTAVGLHRETSALGGESIAFFSLYHVNRLRLLFKHWDNAWLIREWVPAELRHLRTTASNNEIAGLLWSYVTWQAHFATGRAEPNAPVDGWDEPAGESGPAGGSELAWTLRQVAAKRAIEPAPLTSRFPGVGRIREWLARIATEEYVRPILQQQNDFNAALVELASALERQRRTSDGAALCQGMLLAKLLAEKSIVRSP